MSDSRTTTLSSVCTETAYRSFEYQENGQEVFDLYAKHHRLDWQDYFSDGKPHCFTQNSAEKNLAHGTQNSSESSDPALDSEQTNCVTLNIRRVWDTEFSSVRVSLQHGQTFQVKSKEWVIWGSKEFIVLYEENFQVQVGNGPFEDKMSAPILSIIPFKVFIKLPVEWTLCVWHVITPSPFNVCMC